MRKTLIVGACGLALTLGAAGCGGSDEPISEAKLADRLVDEGLKPKFAQCVAKEIYPDLSEDEKKALNKEEGDAETRRKVQEKAGAAGGACVKKGVGLNQ